jgi:hypothetical protein
MSDILSHQLSLASRRVALVPVAGLRVLVYIAFSLFCRVYIESRPFYDLYAHFVGSSLPKRNLDQKGKSASKKTPVRQLQIPVQGEMMDAFANVFCFGCSTINIR